MKYRLNNSAGDPLEAVTVGKQKKISAASIFYMNHKGINPYDTFIRYDVIGIDGDNNITHIENAFDYIK